MAYFLLTKDEHACIVSAKCISCARNIAAGRAGKEGPMVWRQAAVKLLADHDPIGFVFKGVIQDEE